MVVMVYEWSSAALYRHRTRVQYGDVACYTVTMLQVMLYAIFVKANVLYLLILRLRQQYCTLTYSNRSTENIRTLQVILQSVRLLLRLSESECGTLKRIA